MSLQATVTHIVPTLDVMSLKVNNMQMPRVALGSQLFFRVEVRDLSSATQALTTPGTTKTITIRKPNGVVAASAQAMTEASTGILTYVHQTAVTDPPGVWQVSFNFVHSGATVKVGPMDAVEMTP